MAQPNEKTRIVESETRVRSASRGSGDHHHHHSKNMGTVMETMGGPKCARYTLYACNLLILILACVVLGTGIWLSSSVSSFVTALNPALDPTNGIAGHALADRYSGGVSRFQTVANVLITAGVFALLISFLGFWAAYKESKSLLITYGVILILVILLELGAGIAFAVDRPKITNGVAKDYARAVANYDYLVTRLDENNRLMIVEDRTNSNRTEASTLLVNLVQTWVGCCGGNTGFHDFAGSPYWAKAGMVPPIFCCKLKDRKTLELEDASCAKIRTIDNSWMNTGCANKTVELVNKEMPSIIGVSVGIGLINILGVVAAFYLYYTLAHGYREF